ncbi:uncharacterized protein LOC122301787 [Carya illinoinensis]|uniref:uncharacterized protein LOC122301787 n=1 Tax=Carya illinoinensis TaxID=32201 RepID=UPI001C728FFC|nr:uncharacterized protein LOC122301787 [Carya illinoinensis]
MGYEGRKGWKKLLQLNIQGVTKIFVWKTLNNCLPTKGNLFKRRVVDNPLCPICEKEFETSCHAIWSCPTAVDVWAEEGSLVKKWASSEVDIEIIWKNMVERLIAEEMRLIAIVMRCIWLRRNKFVFEKGFTSPKDILIQARHNVIDFQLPQTSKLESIKRQRRDMVRWKAPDKEIVKLNWDAAYDKTSQ